jgi:hypothetical protein
MAEINRSMMGHKLAEERSASSVSNPTSEFSIGNFSSHLNVSQDPRLTESGGRVSSLYGPGGIRQTEMKLKVAEIDDGRPPERMKDYKGRIRVRASTL